MDNSLFESLSHLRKDWIKRVLEEHEQERREHESSVVKLLQNEGRRAMWTMCKILGADSNGVPGRACRLVERYLHTYITNFCNLTVDDEQRRNFKRELFSRIPLLIASCVQLSAKMSSANSKVNANHVHNCLRKLNLQYSILEINIDAFHVFETLDFRIPLWTGVEEAQLFATEIGMPEHMMESVAVMVNLAEFARDKIEKRVRGIANDSPGSSEGRPVEYLHLVVGAVAASAQYLAFIGPDPVQRLADVTSTPPSFISCIADAILAEVLVESSSPEVPIQPKRRRIAILRRQ